MKKIGSKIKHWITVKNCVLRSQQIFLLIVILFLTGCHPKSTVLEPHIEYYPREQQFQMLPTAFPPLSKSELQEEWGKELKIGTKFAKELDLYRAITAFKRADVLVPRNNLNRKLQIAFGIVACYYLGHKYDEALYTFERSELVDVTTSFPAIEDLIIILYDSYRKTCQLDKADKIMQMLQQASPPTAENLQLSNAILAADFCGMRTLSCGHPCEEEVGFFLNQFCCCHKSVRKAQFLNAILPGAGYAYVGQKRSAITSFVINALFTWASYRFFEQKNYAAGIITASIEAGWYLGGINGAGLEAKYYNERLYEGLGKDTMIDCGIFPVLMLQTSF